MVGGLFIRRVKNWVVAGRNLSSDEPQVMKASTSTGLDVAQVNNKIANLDVRALALLRHRIPKLVIPLACTVDYFGILFEVQSPCFLTLNSLVYGSDSNGVLYKDDHAAGEKIGREIGELLNL
mmetsp:Transcript_29137/g.43912  ORF Transcript_29137/g.43912 Transcript_29137/m.43912 type:complete len:123 (+) Transcript_29137:110-478(+)